MEEEERDCPLPTVEDRLRSARKDINWVGISLPCGRERASLRSPSIERWSKLMEEEERDCPLPSVEDRLRSARKDINWVEISLSYGRGQAFAALLLLSPARDRE